MIGDVYFLFKNLSIAPSRTKESYRHNFEARNALFYRQTPISLQIMSIQDHILKAVQ